VPLHRVYVTAWSASDGIVQFREDIYSRDGLGAPAIRQPTLRWTLPHEPGRPMKEPSVVHSDANILGGIPVFVGTRVPVQALIDYIEGGRSLNTFLDDFPTVTREIAIAALEQAKARLIADASAT
jgi:uncharacterized protein (DUF433 family)